jgi:dihydroxyacetone kinase
MVAKLGRMQTLGQRSIGYVDPGSITMALIFISMDEFLSKQQP